MGADGPHLLARLGPFVPRLECHKKEGVIRGLNLAQEAETFDGRISFHAGRIFQNTLDFLADGIGAFERGGVGQLGDDIRVTLIFLRQKRGCLPCHGTDYR